MEGHTESASLLMGLQLRGRGLPNPYKARVCQQDPAMGPMGVPLHVIVLISEVAVGSRAVGCFAAVKLSMGCRRSSASSFWATWATNAMCCVKKG